MEAALSGVLSLLIALKFTDMKSKKADEEIRALTERVELLSNEAKELDQQLAGKLMQTLLPVAKAVNRLNQEIGL